jgi:hypothetical protein
VAGVIDEGRRWSSVRGREAAFVGERKGGGDLVSMGTARGERAWGRGEMRLGACDPYGSGPSALTRGVIFGRPQPSRVAKRDFSFSLEQG